MYKVIAKLNETVNGKSEITRTYETAEEMRSQRKHAADGIASGLFNRVEFISPEGKLIDLMVTTD